MPVNHLVFVVDENLNNVLYETVRYVANDAGAIFNVDSVYAGFTPGGYPSSRFTNAGIIVGTTEFGVQRDAKRIIGELNRCLGHVGRNVIFITTYDLTARINGNNDYLKFCFGLVIRPYAVISMVRFYNLPINEQKYILAGLIMHVTGHLYKVASDITRFNTTNIIGVHCTNRQCVMRQALNVGTIRSNFAFLRARNSSSYSPSEASKYYCPLCVDDINNYISAAKGVVYNTTTATPQTRQDPPPMPPRRKNSTPPSSLQGS